VERLIDAIPVDPRGIYDLLDSQRAVGIQQFIKHRLPGALSWCIGFSGIRQCCRCRDGRSGGRVGHCPLQPNAHQEQLEGRVQPDNVRGSSSPENLIGSFPQIAAVPTGVPVTEAMGHKRKSGSPGASVGQSGSVKSSQETYDARFKKIGSPRLLA
jgi:hypothetical protein